MKTYIELRNLGGVLDWRVLEHNDATTSEIQKAIAECACDLIRYGMAAGDTIAVYESDKTPNELKLQ